MAEKEELQWITVNGKHIPIKPGESKKEAITKAFGEDRDGFDNENSDKEVYDAYMKEAAEETARVNTGQQKKVKGQGVNIESDELKKKYTITNDKGEVLGEVEANSEQEAFDKASEQFPGRDEELFVDEIEEDKGPRFKEGSTVTVEDGSKGTIEKVFNKDDKNNEYIVRFEDGTSGNYDDSDFADDGSYRGMKNDEPGYGKVDRPQFTNKSDAKYVRYPDGTIKWGDEQYLDEKDLQDKAGPGALNHIRDANEDEANKYGISKDELGHLSNMMKEYGVEIIPTPTHQSKYEIKTNKLPYLERQKITERLEKMGYEVQGDGNGNLNIWTSLNEPQYNSKRNDWIINDFLGQYGYRDKLSPEERAVIAKILRLK